MKPLSIQGIHAPYHYLLNGMENTIVESLNISPVIIDIIDYDIRKSIINGAGRLIGLNLRNKIKVNLENSVDLKKFSG